MKTSFLSRAFVLIAAVSLAGCLRTRSEVRENEQRQVLSQTVNSLQKENADAGSRFNDLNEEIRELRGRVEVAENKISRGDTESDRGQKAIAEQSQEAVRRASLLQETVTRLDVQMQAMNAEVQALRAEVAAARAQQGGSAASSAASKSSWDVGVAEFDQKNWKKAILAFQDYREKNPKGKNAAEATYRMGVAFQELGLKDEAKTFYDETIARYPQSNEAKKSKIRLKNLKSPKK